MSLREHLKVTRLFGEPGIALLAVSGGSDSVALLDLLVLLAPELGLSLVVGHVAHGIRQETAAVVPRVRELAAGYGFPCHVETLALGPNAGETVARRERYRALRRIQRHVGARYLVTAHQQDDQVETVLYRFLRGSAVAGLAGIPSTGPGGLVRPLLPYTRSELMQWLTLRYPDPETRPFVFDDPANADMHFDRSWLRHQLLPFLKQRFGSSVDQRLLHVGEYAEADRHAWGHVLRTLPGLEFHCESNVAELARVPLQRYDKTLSQAVLRAAAREVGCRLGPRRAALLGKFLASSSSGRSLQLGSGWEAQLVFDRVRLTKAGGAGAESPARQVSACEAAEGCVSWEGWEFVWRSGTAGTACRESWSTWLTSGLCEIRGFRAGDRILPIGGVGRRKVCRLLMEAGVPATERRRYPVVARGTEVLWVPGVCRSAGAVPQSGEPAVWLEARATGNR